MFVWLYLAMAIMWFLYATPGLLLENLTIIMITQSLADFIVYIVSLISVQITFYTLRKQNLGTIVSLLIFTASIIYFLGRAYAPLPHIREAIYPYVYWRADIPLWLPMMTGVVAALSSILFIATFLSLGYKARQNAIVFKRSLYLASGMTCLLLASVVYFVVPIGRLFSVFGASLLGIGGLIIVLQGIPFHHNAAP